MGAYRCDRHPSARALGLSPVRAGPSETAEHQRREGPRLQPPLYRHPAVSRAEGLPGGPWSVHGAATRAGQVPSARAGLGGRVEWHMFGWQPSGDRVERGGEGI